MTLKTLSLSVAFIGASLSGAAVADSGTGTRLVITHESAPTVGARAASITSDAPTVEVFEVPEGQDADAVSAEIRRMSGVKAVEADVPMSNPRIINEIPVELRASGALMASQAGIPNDPEFGSQYYWNRESNDLRGQSHFLAAFDQFTPEKRVNVAIIDGGFENNADFSWDGGYNFATIDSARGPDYLTYDADNCTSYHGQAVGAIVGATANNGVGMAGMVNAGMYALRALGCSGNGYLSDAAEAIRYAAGDTESTGTHIGVDIDVINLSLGATVSSCPLYMQEAIDYATAKGITVVVAAGNDSIDASGYSPANCNGVVTVGAVNRQGDQADFSNYGNAVNVSALGEQVLSQGSFNPHSLWFGTSFATPIYAGMTAFMTQLDYTLSADMIKSILMSSATRLGNTSNKMGVGVLNSRQAIDKYNDLIQSQPTLTNILKSSDRCDTTIYSSYYAKHFDACELTEFDGSELGKPDGDLLVLYQIPKGSTYSRSNGTLVSQSTEDKFLVRDVDSTLFDYGVAVCDGEGLESCPTSLLPVDVSGADAPVSCESSE